MAFKMKGVPHYMKDGTEYKGDTHKMKDGTLHTGKTHTEDSELLSHKKPPFQMKSPLRHAGGLWHNINHKKKSGTSRSKANSTISPEAYANMEKGFKK